MSIPEVQSFHLGMVVRSLDTTMKQYSDLFDISNWQRPKARYNGLEMAYGRGGGQTFELFEVTAPGDSHIHQFFEQHGEGINHIGFWMEDIPSAVRRAVDSGAELLSLTADAAGNATAQFIPAPDVTETHFQQLGLVSFVKPTGGVLIEYVGRAGETFLRDWFKDDFDNLVVTPPWRR